MILVPSMTLAGGVWGVLASMPTEAVVSGGLLGGALFGTATWLYLRIQPFVSWSLDRRYPRAGRWLAAGIDSLLVGGAAWTITDGIGIDPIPAATAAVTLGAVYSAAVVGFFDEGGTRAISGVLGVVRGGGTGIRIPPYSHIQTLLQRRDWASARAELEAFVDEHPSDPRGWLDLGRLLHREFGESEAGVHALRRGVDRARMDALVHRQYVATILDIRRATGEPERAGRDLAVLAEATDGTPSADWARRELEELRRAADAGASDPADVHEGDEEREKRQE